MTQRILPNTAGMHCYSAHVPAVLLRLAILTHESKLIFLTLTPFDDGLWQVIDLNNHSWPVISTPI